MEEKDITLKENFNDETKVITLQDIIDKSKQFVSGEITQEEMGLFGGKITIRSYLPILDKMSLIMSILNEHIYSDVETQEIKTVEMYRNIFFYIMLSGYAGIDCTDRNLVTYTNYDLLYPIFAPFILSYCKDDYELTIQMLKDSINFYNIKDIADGFKGINEEALKEAINSNKKIIEDLNANKELIHELNEIAQFNDPNTKNTIKNIQRIALDDANHRLAEDKENKKNAIKKSIKSSTKKKVNIEKDKKDGED